MKCSTCRDQLEVCGACGGPAYGPVRCDCPDGGDPVPCENCAVVEDFPTELEYRSCPKCGGPCDVYDINGKSYAGPCLERCASLHQAQPEGVTRG